MAGLDKVFSSVLPPAAATPIITENQDQILENLMNEFMTEEAKSQPTPPPLGTNHTVKIEADPEEVLRSCLESFALEADGLQQPIDFQEQMKQQSIKLIDLQLKEANKFFAQLVAQPKDSLPQWLANQDKLMVQALFLGSKQTKTMLEWSGAIIKPMISSNILHEWTVNYPLALLRVQEQPELQSYIPNALEEQEMMSEMLSHFTDATTGHAKASLGADIKVATHFFEKFLAIKDDEEAKNWLTAQRNKKDPQDPECYSYSFSKVRQLVEALDQKPNLVQMLDEAPLQKCLENFTACAKRLKKIGLEQVIEEMDPLTQEKMQKEFVSILSFFKDLLPQLKKDSADPEQIKKWIEGQDSFKYLPFLVAKSSVIINYENIPSKFHPLAKEIGELYKECLPFLKKLGLEFYLKVDPNLQLPGLTQKQMDKFNSQEL